MENKINRVPKEVTNNKDTIQLLSFTGGDKNLTFTLEKTKVYGWNLETNGEVYVLREEHHIEPVVITEAAAHAIMDDPMKGYILLYTLLQLRHVW
jgi:hypothetical protein